MNRVVSLAAIALAIAMPSLVRAQEAPPPSAAPAPVAPARFDLAASLAEGDEELSAARAVELATGHSPRIEAARASVRVAEGSLHAATVALVPRLDLGARYAHVDGFPDGQIQPIPGGPAVAFHIPRDQGAFTARLTVPLSDIFFAALPAMEAADQRLRAERSRIDAAESDVAFAAIEAFYRYVEARGVLAVATSGRDQAMALRDQIVRYADAGIVGPADRAAAEARVAQAEEALARAEAAVEVSGAALSIALGTPAGARYRVAGAVPETLPAAPGGLEALESAALEQRADLRAMREAIAATSRARDATIATGYPHVSVYGYAEESNPNPRIIPPTQAWNPLWELGAALTWSPNDTASALFHADEMAAQIAAAEEQMHATEDAVRLEVRQSVAELRTSERSLAAAHASAEAAEEAYRTQLAALGAGESTLNDLILADGRANEARLADLRARIAASLASARLAHATGQLTAD